MVRETRRQYKQDCRRAPPRRVEFRSRLRGLNLDRLRGRPTLTASVPQGWESRADGVEWGSKQEKIRYTVVASARYIAASRGPSASNWATLSGRATTVGGGKRPRPRLEREARNEEDGKHDHATIHHLGPLAASKRRRRSIGGFPPKFAIGRLSRVGLHSGVDGLCRIAGQRDVAQCRG